MPPLIFFLFYMILLLMIPAKCIIGLVSSRRITENNEASFTKVLVVVASISLFFSIYFFMMMSAGLKGSVIFGPTAIMCYIIAVSLFANSIANDIIALLYSADPESLKRPLRYSSGALLINFVIYIAAYFVMVIFLGKSLQVGLAKDTT